MQHLIEGANIQMTEAAESINDFQASFMNNASFKAGVTKQLEDSDNRRHQLEVQMIQYEEEREQHQAELKEKDRTINKLE